MRPVHSSITDNSVQEASRVYVGSGEIPRPVQVSAQARRQTIYGEQNQQVFTLNGQVDLTQQVCALNRQPDLTQQVCRLNRQPDITQQVCILNRQTDGTPGNTTCHDDTSKSKSTVGEHENWVPVHSSAQATNQTMPRDHTQQASTSNSQTSGNPVVKMEDIVSNDLRAENNSIKNNLQQVLRHWQHERARSKSLARVLLEERKQRAKEGESLRSKLKDASVTIQDLLNKVRLLESSRITFTCKTER
ncbi:hypothetical protein P3S68_012844 [Capsicum galapagoense]